jgi:hypothetical protein
MSKIIEIHRYFNLVEMQQSDPEVKAWLGQSYRGIGPYFKDKATATGLSFEEQRFLLPELLGIEHTDKDFRRTVNKFFDELVTSVPKEGLKLQIGLEDDSRPLASDNMPINIMDYIRFRHLRGHRDVAMNESEAAKTFGKRFYIVDPEAVSSSATSLNTLEDKTIVVYMKFKDDRIKTDQILTMLGVNIKNMRPEEKVLKLKELSQKNNKLNDYEQKEAFERFLAVAEDKDLEYKYLIQEMIGTQYLKRVGNNILYTESGKKVGDNLDDAVLYFKNPKNSRELNLMKAEYNTKVKKGDAYLPKADPEEVSEPAMDEVQEVSKPNATKKKTE